MEKTTYTTHTGTPPTAIRSTTVVQQQPPTVVQQHTTYTPPTVHATHVSVVNQQPAVVHHHVYQSGPTLGGFLSSVGQAVSTVAVETSKVVAQVVQPVVAVECFMPGFVVELRSKVSGKTLALQKDGLVNCSGDGGATCHFKIVSTGRAGVYKLRNVAQPNNYLGYVKGFIVGYGTGDKDCEFIVSMVQDRYVTLEVCHHLGNFVGALPTGQITDPAQTEKSSEVAQFAPYVVSM